MKKTTIDANNQPATNSARARTTCARAPLPAISPSVSPSIGPQQTEPIVSQILSAHCAAEGTTGPEHDELFRVENFADFGASSWLRSILNNSFSEAHSDVQTYQKMLTESTSYINSQNRKRISDVLGLLLCEIQLLQDLYTKYMQIKQ